MCRDAFYDVYDDDVYDDVYDDAVAPIVVIRRPSSDDAGRRGRSTRTRT